MKFSAILLPVLPLLIQGASAWRLQLYRDQQFMNIIEDRRGTLSQPCKNLAAAYNDEASSMHWYADGVVLDCQIVLYRDANCLEAGGILGRSRGDWHLAGFSEQANDELSSYKINC